jgi:hypothetical protein
MTCQSFFEFQIFISRQQIDDGRERHQRRRPNRHERQRRRHDEREGIVERNDSSIDTAAARNVFQRGNDGR